MDDREWKNQEQNQEQFNEQFAELQKLWKELNTLKLQLEQVQKKGKSDFEQQLAILQEKFQNYSQKIEAWRELHFMEKKEILELKKEIKALLVQKNLWKLKTHLENSQTSPFLLNQKVSEGKKESVEKIVQIADGEDENRIAATMQKWMRKLIPDLMKKMVS